MKKRITTVLIAIVLAVLMTVISPIQTLAASRKLYISDIRMSSSIEKLEELGYTVLEKDLNAGTSWYDITRSRTRSEYLYIGYKTTTDPNEAITDISVMDMKGGYSFGDYEDILERQEKNILISIEMFRVMLNEFSANYKAGSPAALKAYTALNNYIEDDSGRLIGDLFLDETLSDDDLVKVFMQSNMLALYCLQTAVTVGLSNHNEESILQKLSTLGPVETEADYFDEASALLGNVEVLRDTLLSYVNSDVDTNDSDAVEEYLDTITGEAATEFLQNSMLYNLLNAYAYGDSGMTLAEFFMSDEIEVRDLYPLVSVMTGGQLAAAQLNGFLMLFLSSENDVEAYAKAQKDLSSEIKETLDPISVYTGIDRSMYEGGVAITSDVQRKSAYTGDTSWAYGNIDSRAEIALFALAGISALTSIVYGTAAVLLTYMWTTTVDGMLPGTAFNYFLANNPCVQWVFKSFKYFPRYGQTVWLTTGAIIFYVSLAILALTAIVYFSHELHYYYRPEYTEIPLILLDLKFGESDNEGDWEKYVRYNVVRDEKGDAGDLNCFMGKQWNAMYVTKDRAAGDPILASSFVVQYGDETAPRNYLPVHYFGGVYAMNLNNHCYNDDVDGVFLFYRSDDKAFASETASVFGSGALAAVTGFGGLVVGAFGAIIITKKKKVNA